MKWLAAGFITLVSSIFINTTSTQGLSAEPYTAPPDLVPSPVIVTNYSLTGKLLDYVQLFNSSDIPVSLDGWSIDTLTSTGERTSIIALSGYIAPLNYLVVSHGIVVGSDFIDNLSNDFTTGSPSEVQVVPSESAKFNSEVIKLTKEGEYQRKISTSTGKYLSTFEAASNPLLYGGGFYVYPISTSLIATEVLAHPRGCSPLDGGLDCADYVKLYNPSKETIDLSQYRLRSGYKAQSVSTSNTYLLSGVIEPGHYTVITADADGRGISLTNSGGYIWLEDTYGIKTYDTTVQAYEDASAETKEGMAWAYDFGTGLWSWTTSPTPWDAPSRFTQPIAKEEKPTEVSVTPCPVGQYRSEETHRCRAIATATTLKPCPTGQYRSPDSNRCRSVATVASEVKPCEPGYERNPETNRCRKKSEVLSSTDFKTDPTVAANKTFSGWWTLGGIGILAVGYGVWEWREEIFGATRNLGMFFTSRK